MEGYIVSSPDEQFTLYKKIQKLQEENLALNSSIFDYQNQVEILEQQVLNREEHIKELNDELRRYEQDHNKSLLKADVHYYKLSLDYYARAKELEKDVLNREEHIKELQLELSGTAQVNDNMAKECGLLKTELKELKQGRKEQPVLGQRDLKAIDALLALKLWLSDDDCKVQVNPGSVPEPVL
jgi:chromosome segregation ATPase